MTAREMEKLIKHFDRFFEQNDSLVLHAKDPGVPHIDLLLYSPNKRYPFWKLTTMGASDFEMPKVQNMVARRNEYMLFVDAGVDLQDPLKLSFFTNILASIAHYPAETNTAISYGHSVEWGSADDTQMVGAFIELPQIIDDAGILTCKLGLLKTTACLQIALLTQREADELQRLGPQSFSSQRVEKVFSPR